VASAQALGALGLERAQIAINTVPMVHASGLFCLLSCLRRGAIQSLVERFDADAVLDAIERYYGTWLIGLPFMFAELLKCQLADYKVPERLQSIAEIPRNAIGKIDRRSLVSMLSADTSQPVRAA